MEGPKDSDFKGAKECGVNAVIAHTYFIDKILEFAGENGIKILFGMGGNMAAGYFSNVKKLMNNPNIGALMLIDEPYYLNWHDSFPESFPESFPGSIKCDIEECFKEKWRTENLCPLYKDIHDLYEEDYDPDKDRMEIFNLAVDSSQCCVYGPYTGNIQAYLEAFQETFKPAVWMYDFYPWRKDGSILWIEEFYFLLKTFADLTAKYGRPFWTYCQSVSYKNMKGEYVFPIPTLAMFRWQIFSMLAFGSKGIAYWHYAERTTMSNIEYVMCPIDLEGKRTKIWYDMQKVNSEIKRYTDVFLNSKLVSVKSSKEIKYTGNGFVNKQVVEVLSLPFGPIESMTGAPEGVIVSHLQNGDRNFIVIVSMSMNAAPKLNITFNFVL